MFERLFSYTLYCTVGCTGCSLGTYCAASLGKSLRTANPWKSKMHGLRICTSKLALSSLLYLSKLLTSLILNFFVCKMESVANLKYVKCFKHLVPTSYNLIRVAKRREGELCPWHWPYLGGPGSSWKDWLARRFCKIRTGKYPLDIGTWRSLWPAMQHWWTGGIYTRWFWVEWYKWWESEGKNGTALSCLSSIFFLH